MTAFVWSGTETFRIISVILSTILAIEISFSKIAIRESEPSETLPRSAFGMVLLVLVSSVNFSLFFCLPRFKGEEETEKSSGRDMKKEGGEGQSYS